MAAKKNQCLVPGCDRTQEHRGQCSACYRQSLRLIEAGKTSWDELESKGWALPPKPRGKPPIAKVKEALESEGQNQ